MNTLTAWIALDYFNAPQWAWGVVGCLYVLLWISATYLVATEKYVDVFEKDEGKVEDVRKMNRQ